MKSENKGVFARFLRIKGLLLRQQKRIVSVIHIKWQIK